MKEGFESYFLRVCFWKENGIGSLVRKKKIPKLQVGEDGFWFRGKIIQIFVLWIEHESRKRKRE